jgi:hypothetical protein
VTGIDTGETGVCVWGGGVDKQIAILWTKLDTGNALLGYFDLKLPFCGDVGGLRERRLVTRNTHTHTLSSEL